MKRIFISAGDYSADIHAQELVKALKSIEPDLHLIAVGGEKLKSVVNEFLANLVKMDISGFSKPILKLPQLLFLLYRKIFPALAQGRVDAVILVDYYDFNIRIAKKAKKLGIPLFYFISPQIWATRKTRIEDLKKTVSRMLVIFPFEEELYKRHGVPVTFVGHPFIESVSSKISKNNFKTIIQNGPLRLGLMPGSRRRELLHHFPPMMVCVKELKKKFQKLECFLFAVDWIEDDYYLKFMKNEPIEIVREKNYEKRSQLHFCLTASGTATLENALLGIPMVVLYQTSWITYLIVKSIATVSFISMPNILSGRKIIPELIQNQANPETLFRAADGLLSNPDLLEKMHQELIELKELLGPPGAYSRAAKIIYDSI